MSRFLNIDIRLLKTRLGELLTVGRGATLPKSKLQHEEDIENAPYAGKKFTEENESSTTLNQSFQRTQDLWGGTPTSKDFFVPEKDFKYYAPNVTTLKQEEKMKKGVKYDEEKPRYALLSPAGLEAEAKAMTYGAKKYGDYNWRKGIAISRYISASLRHIFATVRGEFTDTESGLPHLGLAKANLGMAIQTLEDYPELNDLYKKEDK